MTAETGSTGKSEGPILDPLNDAPPALLVNRPIFVQPESAGLTTIVVPHDPVGDTKGDKWFAQEQSPPGQDAPKIRGGNEVKYLLGGRETFRELARAFACAGKKEDFIYIIAWWLDLELVPVPRADATADDLQANPAYVDCTVQTLLSEAAGRGAQIRALMPAMPGDNAPINKAAKEFINKLNTGAALLDEMTEDLVGSHHQKIVVVKSGEQLTAFCGGVDMNKDRVSVVAAGKGQPLHDVHCRIRGLAAYDLLKIFVERWRELVKWLEARQERNNAFMARMGVPGQSRGPRTSLDAVLVERGWSEDRAKCGDKCTSGEGGNLLGGEALETPAPQNAGRMRVQIARTYGHRQVDPYPFAPRGERSIFQMIKSAIAASERFIYFEDQYMVSADIASLLAERLQDEKRPLEHVTILTSHYSIGDMPRCAEFRAGFVGQLKRFGDRVRIFSLHRPGTQSRVDEFFGSYVHAKVWIFDDEFAIIGSANCNNRGMMHDSEVAAGIYDPSEDLQLTYRLAHRLRIRLWARHLGLETAEGFAELADGIASAAHWLDPPPGARVSEFVNLEPNRPLRNIEDIPGKVGEILPRSAIDPKSN